MNKSLRPPFKNYDFQYFARYRATRFFCYIISASFVHSVSFLADPYFCAHLLVDFALTK